MHRRALMPNLSFQAQLKELQSAARTRYPAMLVRSVSFGLALALLTPVALAQDTGIESNLPGAGFDTPSLPGTAGTPTLQVYSRETIIDVLVTDSGGHPVRGLKQSDFTVEEGGQPQPIRSFYEYDKDAPATPPPALPPNTYSNAHTLPANGPVQIFYLNLPPPTGTDGSLAYGAIIVRAKQYIADYLRTMPAGTEVAIFTYVSDRGLQLVQNFTVDGPRAAAAMDKIVVQRIGHPATADPIAALDQIASYVAGIHGRKNLIWITPAPLPIMRDGGYTWQTPCARDCPPLAMKQAHRLMDTYDRFTKEQIAIYPFDPRGVPAPPARALTFNSLRVEDIAAETGGAAIYNTNDFRGAIAKIVNDTSHYYTLSYVPPRAHDDGHYHPIHIAVDRPGLKLSYRGGYNDEQPRPPDDVLKVHMTQASMGLGSLPSTQLLFDLSVNPSEKPAQPGAEPTSGRRALPSSHATTAYDTLFRLDPTRIAFKQTADGVRHGTLEFDLGAYDPYGKLAAIRSQTLTVTLTPEEYSDFVQTPFKFFLAVDLPAGQLTLRAGVFDNVAGTSGTLEVPLTVQKPVKP